MNNYLCKMKAQRPLQIICSLKLQFLEENVRTANVWVLVKENPSNAWNISVQVIFVNYVYSNCDASTSCSGTQISHTWSHLHLVFSFASTASCTGSQFVFQLNNILSFASAESCTPFWFSWIMYSVLLQLNHVLSFASAESWTQFCFSWIMYSVLLQLNYGLSFASAESCTQYCFSWIMYTQFCFSWIMYTQFCFSWIMSSVSLQLNPVLICVSSARVHILKLCARVVIFKGVAKKHLKLPKRCSFSIRLLILKLHLTAPLIQNV
jgi:hypothetical protein